MLCAVGMFSSGNNLLTHLLKENCCIPEQLELYGNDVNKFPKQIIHGVKCQSCENMFDEQKGDLNTFKATANVHSFHVMCHAAR